MDKVKPLIYYLLGLIIFHGSAHAQTSATACDDVKVTIEITKGQQEGTNTVKIIFGDNGNYKVQLLDSKGKITVHKDLIIPDMKIGEYDLIITDQSNSNRCPYYKRIKIEGH